MHSYHTLCQRLHLTQDIPYTEHWSAAADFITLIVDDCLQRKPQTIVECSSGLTTLMLARCCQINQQGKVWSLENGSQYAERTRQFITSYQLQEYVEILDAPLIPYSLQDITYQWYEITALPSLSIDMLVIDGPPGYLQKYSRFPAIPLFFEYFTQYCRVFLDDAARPDEQDIIHLWQKAYPTLQHQYITTQRGCSILEMDKATAATMPI